MNLLGRLIVILYHHCMMAKEFHNTELSSFFFRYHTQSSN